MFNLKNTVITSLMMMTLVQANFANGEGTIKDNSFLIEEAYNQEAGVVQFINAYQYSDISNDWNYTFTNEIPMGDETHQFSYVIPMSKKSGTPNVLGTGDVLLNYRFQLVNTENLAMAPRLSLVLATGDYKKGLGNGATGLQFNQAVSVVVNEKWTNHWNAGFTYTPNAKNMIGDTASLVNYNFGTSVIYNYTPKTNFICEFVMNGNEAVTGPSSKTSRNTYFVVPGLRTAFNIGEATEVVPGIAAVLGAGPSAVDHETGVFAYLSIESKLW